ncbi:MAG: efflux RND transporter periplasmic adaptor subunit [Bryobacterales bacterium]|nr:efflux RND transporter periplasmic adaptor subunit [Bryobacterales bacterium]
MRYSPSLLFAPAAFAVICCFSGCERSSPRAVQAKTPAKAPSVAVALVTRQDLADDLELAAEFRPYQEIDLHAKVSGYLKEIHVDIGDRVKAGQLLAVLEVPEMAQDLAHAEASFKRSELEVERARGEVRRAEINRGIRRLSAERLSGVMKARPNLVARQEYDAVMASSQDAEAQYEAAKANLAASEEQVRIAASNKARIDTMLAYLRITAPFAGLITQRRGDPGALVQAGTASHTQALPVVRLSQVDRLRLAVPVPAAVVPRVHVGAPVEVRVDSLQRVVQGRVARLNGRLEASTRAMEVQVDVPNPDYEIKPGMYGYASLRLDKRSKALAVPIQAINGRGESASVYIVGLGKQIDRRTVETGMETPNLVELVSGVREGEMVVVGMKDLKPGTLVEPKLIREATHKGDH